MRKIVRLTESDLHKIVKESVNMILEWHPKKQPKGKAVKELSPRQQEIYNYLLDSINEEGIDDEELRQRASDLYVAFRDGLGGDSETLEGRPLQYYNDIVTPIIEASNGNQQDLVDFKTMAIKLMTNCRTRKVGEFALERRKKGDAWCGGGLIGLRKDFDQEFKNNQLNPDVR